MSFASSVCVTLVLLLTLASCGNKPDGTPYGVNPAKDANGKLKPTAGKLPLQPAFKGNKIPKGAELNAITNGARSGQPMQQMPLDNIPAR
jgi:hypothetical protein